MSLRLRRLIITLLSLLTLLNVTSIAGASIRESITIAGAEQGVLIWDTGTVTVTADGYSKTVAYGQYSTASSIASALAAKFSQDCNSPVNARGSGATITFQLKSSQPQTTFPLIASITYDSTDFLQASFQVVGQDADGDGLPDQFETQVADLFTPYYHVSADEHTGTAFGIMGDYDHETPIALHGPVPPYSYYRVKPLGFSTVSGVEYGSLRIDYLTLWNLDDGLPASVGCQVSETIAMGLAGVAGTELLTVISAHDLDNERSIMLVTSPTTTSNTYNPDPSAYSAYSYYTAAHEETLWDQSVPWQLYNWPAGTHPEVALATGKHGTYFFNPDGLVLSPDWMIAVAYSTLDDLYWNGWIDNYTYWTYYFAASEAFFGCLVERFSDRGGAFADVRTNVGEPEHPINGSHFILDSNSGLLQKLQ
jgi:hypothetical protein